MLKKHNKQKNDSLGRALMNAQRKQNVGRRMVNKSLLHNAEMDEYETGYPIMSVTEETTIQKFLATAQLSEDRYDDENSKFKIINSDLQFEDQAEIDEKYAKFNKIRDKPVPIPRRPSYTRQMSTDELNRKEQSSFIDWRRSLAEMEEMDGVLLTPYEKNLEIWRQLWRVVERSDIIVQIVDSRNPLFFYSIDLEKYVKEVSTNKLNMILLNKADLLTLKQRQQWKNYFDSINVKAVFFSALLETKVEMASIPENNEVTANIEETNKAGEQLNEQKSNEKNESILEENTDVKDNSNTTENDIDPCHIYTRKELITLFRTLYKGPKINPEVTTVGLVGYPNVGKSSTINSLLTTKKVSVSATPGKTKHFQTLYIEEDNKKDLLLCDCPGLVMPSMVFTKADMLLNGILPIDNMKDPIPSINLLINMIPKYIFEDVYGIVLPELLRNNNTITADELLSAHAYNRGFMTANGQPDRSRSSRYILKDFVNGKLLYCYAPPNVDQKTFNTFPSRQRKIPQNHHLPDRMLRAVMPEKLKIRQLDNQLGTDYGKIHSKSDNTSVTSDKQSINESKPWKAANKHKNKNKKEKLRRVYSHLDQH